MDDKIRQAQIIIVDDEMANVALLERILKMGGYTNYLSTTDPRKVLALFKSHPPDLLLLDLHMPHLDGFTLMEQICARIETTGFMPILVLTADVSREAKQRALSAGAKDFLAKPLDAQEVLLRIRNLLETRFLHQAVLNQNVELEARVRERTRDLEIAHMDTIQRLARAGEFRDDETGQHAQRIGKVAAILAKELGLNNHQAELIRRAAPLHDIGKIGIPDSILLKPTKLTESEYETMKKHTTLGASILAGSRSPSLQMAEEIALYHHERWDGKGYMALEEDAIPIAARIVAAVDAFDAMTNNRPYREAFSQEHALEEIQSEAGKQFDPDVAAAFTRLFAHDRLDTGMFTPAPPVEA